MPGKYSDRIAERIHSVSLNGWSEELGDVQGFGWYGLLHFRRASVILSEDSLGFVDAAVMPRPEAEEAWAELEADCESFETCTEDDS